MPPPIRVELLPHDPAWIHIAQDEARRLRCVLGPELLIAVHHIGSTAIPGIHAKPIIDLMPVVTAIERLDTRSAELEALGYQCWGELGLPGRRYYTKDDPLTGKRMVQLHAYAHDAADVMRHLAFRDGLLHNPTTAAEYDQEKQRCQRLHPDDSHAYADCKSEWIRAIEARALATITTDSLSQE